MKIKTGRVGKPHCHGAKVGLIARCGGDPRCRVLIGKFPDFFNRLHGILLCKCGLIKILRSVMEIFHYSAEEFRYSAMEILFR